MFLYQSTNTIRCAPHFPPSYRKICVCTAPIRCRDMNIPLLVSDSVASTTRYLGLTCYRWEAVQSTGFSRFAYAIFVYFVNLFYMLKLVPLEEKIHYGFRKRTITRLAKISLTFVPSRVLLWGINCIRNKRFAGTTLADSCGWFGRARLFFDAAWFENTTRVEFEGQLFNAPIGAERFLEWVYGDFMTPISAEEQEEELKFAYRYYVTPLRQLGVIAS